MVPVSQDQMGRVKVPDWQRMAGKAAKEVEKFAKEKADIVLMHWRDKMGIVKKEVRPTPSCSRGGKGHRVTGSQGHPLAFSH